MLSPTFATLRICLLPSYITIVPVDPVHLSPIMVLPYKYHEISFRSISIKASINRSISIGIGFTRLKVDISIFACHVRY